MSILLETKNLHLASADKILCCDLNLQIKSGEIWGILGPNGSGKTTLLHALANLRAPQQGEIFLRQKKLSSYNSKQRAQRLGILFQESTEIFSQTVFEFCLAGRHPHLSQLGWESNADKDIALQALTQMQLEKFASRKVETLSGGERRRLNIAALLTQTPEIFLLDEATNHLDLQHQAAILQHFKKLARETSVTIVATLHDINMAQYFCNKVLLLMSDGESLQDTPQEIFTQTNLQRLYQQNLHAIHFANQNYWLPEYQTTEEPI